MADNRDLTPFQFDRTPKRDRIPKESDRKSGAHIAAVATIIATIVLTVVVLSFLGTLPAPR